MLSSVRQFMLPYISIIQAFKSEISITQHQIAISKNKRLIDLNNDCFPMHLDSSSARCFTSSCIFCHARSACEARNLPRRGTGTASQGWANEIVCVSKSPKWGYPLLYNWVINMVVNHLQSGMIRQVANEIVSIRMVSLILTVGICFWRYCLRYQYVTVYFRNVGYLTSLTTLLESRS